MTQPHSEPESVSEVLKDAATQLHSAGISDALAEAELLLAHVLEVPRAELAKMKLFGVSLTDQTTQSLRNLVERRSERIPLQLLTGQTGFFGLDIDVEPGVFIPRPETEILVELALNRAVAVHSNHSNGCSLTLMDLCTGTGAIAVALSDQLTQRGIRHDIVAVEKSPTAIALAQRNVHRLAPESVYVVHADATDPKSLTQRAPEWTRLAGTVDIVVANPPYIPQHRVVDQPEASHDPAEALYGGSADGTLIPGKIADSAGFWLRDGGALVMEHDETHAQLMVQRLQKSGSEQESALWKHIVTHQDLTGKDRFVTALRTSRTSAINETRPTTEQPRS